MIKIRCKNIILFLVLVLAVSSEYFSQETNHSHNLVAGGSEIVFKKIEKGISSNDVSAISRFLSSQTYLSLSNGISGYYSSNQAYYVLEDFFKLYRVTSFRLNNIHTDDDYPYATGVYNYELKGRRGSAQVYVSLKYAGGKWKITQITIN